MSPVGKKVVFQREGGRSSDLYVLDYDNQRDPPRRITADPGREANPDWGPK
jgi:Tol biopolymer transport system component